MENNELQHAGIKGMKWGRRRYQNPDGTWTALGKARRREGDGNDDDPNEDIEAKKQRILRSKSAETIYKNAHLFTDQEIANAANRLGNEARIKALIPAKKPGLKEKIAASLKTAVLPAVTEQGKKYLTKVLEEKLGLKEKKDPFKQFAELLKNAENAKKLKEIGYDYGNVIDEEIRKLGYTPK